MNGFNLSEIISEGPYLLSKSLPLSHNASDIQIINRLSAYDHEFSPSDEQLAIIKAVLSGGDVKVQAFAGTGKTTTIKLITQCVQKNGLYIAFNKEIVGQARALEKTEARTAHSLAYSETVKTSPAYRPKYQDRNKLWSNKTLRKTLNVDIQNIECSIIKNILKGFIKSADDDIGVKFIEQSILDELQSRVFSTRESVETLLCYLAEVHRDKAKTDEATENRRRSLLKQINTDTFKKSQAALSELFTSQEQNNLVRKIAKNSYSYSPKAPISVEDFPSKEYQKISSLEGGGKQEKIDMLVHRWLQLAKLFWEAIIDPSQATPIDDDSYLKLWQLQKPQLKADIIYIDEAQDLDPVMLDVLQRQPAQKVWLGDEFQQIYEWRGAVNALEIIECKKRLYLTETYRFPPTIAEAANKVLKKLNVPREIVTHVHKNSQKKHNSFVFIARTNKTLFSKALELAAKRQKFSWKKFNIQSLKWNCEQIVNLANNKRAGGLYEDFSSIEELKDHLENNPSDVIKRAYDLCEEYIYNLTKITKALHEIEQFNDLNHKYELTTAHQSKGLEWDFVLLSDDFNNVKLRPDGEIEKSEWNLLYVAITRAKQSLQLYTPTIAALFDSQAEGQLRVDEPKALLESARIELPSPELFYDKSSRELYSELLTQKVTPPIIGYDCEENKRVVGTLEFAWPECKVGIFLPDEPIQLEGWQLLSIDEVKAGLERLKSLLTASQNNK